MLSNESNRLGCKLDKFAAHNNSLEGNRCYPLSRQRFGSSEMTWANDLGFPFIMFYFIQQFMLALIERSPNIYLDEIQKLLLELHDIDVSLDTVRRTQCLPKRSASFSMYLESESSTKYLLTALSSSSRKMRGSSATICVGNWLLSTRISHRS